MTNSPEETPKVLFQGLTSAQEGGKMRYDDSPGAVAERLLAKPTVINMFTDGPDGVFNAEQMKAYLAKTFGPNFAVINQGDIIQYGLKHSKVDEKKNS